jgi:hypothetical protein
MPERRFPPPWSVEAEREAGSDTPHPFVA